MFTIEGPVTHGRLVFQPRHEKTCFFFWPYANNKCTDQPAHPRSLISAFVIRCLDSIIPQVSISKISSLQLVSVAEQTGLSIYLVKKKKKKKKKKKTEGRWWGSFRSYHVLVPLALYLVLMWAASWQNQQSGMCAQRRLRSAWASTQSDQNLRCPHEKKAWVLSYPLSAQWRLIRLGGCPGWSESSLGAQSLCWLCHVAAHV